MSLSLSILFGVCLLVSFLYAGIEAGLLSASRVRLRSRVHQGDPAAIRLDRLLAHPERLLATVLIVTNFADVAALVIVANALVDRYGRWGYLVTGVVMLPVYLLGVQLLPKSLFRRFPYRALAALAGLLEITAKVLAPLLIVVEWTVWLGRARPVSVGKRTRTPSAPEKDGADETSVRTEDERRRTGLPTRLAFAVCEEATRMSGLPGGSMAGVFASANGEGTVVHGLLEDLAVPAPQLSPTAFHNSVHNAVAGYWSIGAGCLHSITCIACHDWTFSAGLLQCFASCIVSGEPMLFCVYDALVPAPLGNGRATGAPFAAAFVLCPQARDGALGRLQLSFELGAAAISDTMPRSAALQKLARTSAAARSLRLLEALATHRADSFCLALEDDHIRCELIPC